MVSGRNVSATMGGFTPLFDIVIQDVGLIGASVFGRMWRYCQGDWGVCQASTATIASELNMSVRTVIRWQQELCKQGYLQDTTPDLRNKPHTYKDTGKVRLKFNMEAVTESHSAESGMTESHSAMTESHSGYDLKSHEETIEETHEETNISPSSGEKLPTKEAESFEDLFPQPEPTPRRTPAQGIEQLQTVTGSDPLSGALKALETASAKSPTVPAVAGGADPWEKVADMFCGLHGLRLVDVRESDRKNWPRKLESIAETAHATPAQMIKAIRALPESEYHFKSYSSPYMKSFEPDIIMLVSQMVAGIDVRAKGNGNNGAHRRDNGAQPTAPGADDAETISRKLAAAIADRS